jgi:hypothetical protein
VFKQLQEKKKTNKYTICRRDKNKMQYFTIDSNTEKDHNVADTIAIFCFMMYINSIEKCFLKMLLNENEKQSLIAQTPRRNIEIEVI